MPWVLYFPSDTEAQIRTARECVTGLRWDPSFLSILPLYVPGQPLVFSISFYVANGVEVPLESDLQTRLEPFRTPLPSRVEDLQDPRGRDLLISRVLDEYQAPMGSFTIDYVDYGHDGPHLRVCPLCRYAGRLGSLPLRFPIPNTTFWFCSSCNGNWSVTHGEHVEWTPILRRILARFHERRFPRVECSPQVFAQLPDTSPGTLRKAYCPYRGTHVLEHDSGKRIRRVSQSRASGRLPNCGKNREAAPASKYVVL